MPLLLTAPAPLCEASEGATELHTCRLTDASAEELNHQALHPDRGAALSHMHAATETDCGSHIL